MSTGELNAGGNPAMDWHPILGGVEILLVASCDGNRDKLRPDGPLCSYADFYLYCIKHRQKNDIRLYNRLTYVRFGYLNFPI